MTEFHFERRPLDLSFFPPEIQKPLSPEAPSSAKMMASMGVLPTPPEITLAALYQLSFDKDPQIANAAGDTLAHMPAELVVPALQKLSEPGVIDWVVAKHIHDDKILTAVARNRNSDPLTIEAIAGEASAAVADVIATNQVRLLENPSIIKALAHNGNTLLTTLNTIYELACREKVALDPTVAQQIELRRDEASPAEVKVVDPLADFVEEKGIDLDTFNRALEDEDRRLEDEIEEQKRFDLMSRSEKEAATEPLEEEDQRELPAFALILNMSIAQKMQYMARCGSEALNILVRDPNRLIHEAAVRSPRVRPIDVSRWSKDKGLPESVLSYIASRRDWIRSYEVLHNLVCNPRTPLADAMNLINHVRTNDLKNLQRNRNVSSNISRHAGILYKKRSGAK